MINVRKAKLSDLDSLCLLFKEFMKYHEKLIKKNPKMKPILAKKKNHIEIIRKFVAKNIKSRNGIVFIAEDDKKPAGYCLSFIKSNTPIFKISKIGYISDLFVKSEYQRKGISTRFKEESFKWFKSKKMKFASIAVRVGNNDAKSIYNHWGFMDESVSLIRKI